MGVVHACWPDRSEIPGSGIATPLELRVEYTSQEDGPVEGGPTHQRACHMVGLGGGAHTSSTPVHQWRSERKWAVIPFWRPNTGVGDLFSNAMN
jgi:hypothetical protein